MNLKRSWYLHIPGEKGELVIYGPFREKFEAQWFQEMTFSEFPQAGKCQIVEKSLWKTLLFLRTKLAWHSLGFLLLFFFFYLLFSLYQEYQDAFIPLDPQVELSFHRSDDKSPMGLKIGYTSLKRNLPFELIVTHENPDTPVGFRLKGILDKRKEQWIIRTWVYDRGIELVPGKYKMEFVFCPFPLALFSTSRIFVRELKLENIFFQESFQRYQSFSLLLHTLEELFLKTPSPKEWEEEYKKNYASFLRDLSLRPLEYYSPKEQDKILEVGTQIGQKLMDLLEEWYNGRAKPSWKTHLGPLIDLLRVQLDTYSKHDNQNTIH